MDPAAPAVMEPSGPPALPRRDVLRVVLWLTGFAALGAALVLLYPDSYQQDGGFHHLFARWSWEHPRLFLDVWGRPLFTTLYALPARLGYPAAKLLTVAVSVAAAWHTAQLARAHGLERWPLAVPLLLLQPSFLLICSETMTEPLFALILAVALRLHCGGRIGASMWVASLLPLTRPEGFFVALLWGAFVIFDPRAGRTFILRAVSSATLSAGVVAWWLASVWMTGNPLFILRNWPSNWGPGFSYGTGPLLQYWFIRDQVLAGPVIQALFALGLAVLLASRRALLPVAALLLVTVLHSVFFRLGMFGSAGYARYLVCVAPPMALATLAGWNLVAGWARALPLLLRRSAAAVVILWASWASLSYVDSYGSSRDAWAVRDMHSWFLAHPRPVTRLVFSQAYMSILMGRDPAERPALGTDPEENVRTLRASPPGTLVFWDAHTGPKYRAIGPAHFERAGYELLRQQTYDLEPRLPHRPPLPPHRQSLVLYYKPGP